MIKKLLLIVVSFVVCLGVALAFTVPVAAEPAGAADVCQGINIGGGNCADNGGKLTSTVQLIVNIISVVAGVAAVIMIIIGGLKYITSGGDSSKVSSAKSTILYAVVGLVIVALAQMIARFVSSSAS